MVDHCRKQLSNYTQERWMKLDTYVHFISHCTACVCSVRTYAHTQLHGQQTLFPAEITFKLLCSFLFLVLKYHICVCFCSAKHAHCYGDIDSVKSLNREMRPCATCTLAHEHTHTYTLSHTYVHTYTFNNIVNASQQPVGHERERGGDKFQASLVSSFQPTTSTSEKLCKVHQ